MPPPNRAPPSCADVGGIVEPDEAPADTAEREALEETGLAVRVSQIRGVIGGPRFRHTYASGDRVAFVSTMFDAPDSPRDESLPPMLAAAGVADQYA